MINKYFYFSQKNSFSASDDCICYFDYVLYALIDKEILCVEYLPTNISALALRPELIFVNSHIFGTI